VSRAARRGRATAGFQSPLAVGDITPAAVSARLSHRLGRMIGPGRRWSYAEGARLTGIRERTLRAYVEGTACPNLARYGRLLRVFGREVGIELALMLGWEPRARAGRLPSESDLHALRAGLAHALRAVETALAARAQPTVIRRGA
jgi:hypothetical protein